MIVGWTKDLPDSKYFEEIAGKIFWWMRCELRKKRSEDESKSLVWTAGWLELLFTRMGQAGGGTGVETGDPEFGCGMVKFEIASREVHSLLESLAWSSGGENGDIGVNFGVRGT